MNIKKGQTIKATEIAKLEADAKRAEELEAKLEELKGSKVEDSKEFKALQEEFDQLKSREAARLKKDNDAEKKEFVGDVSKKLEDTVIRLNEERFGSVLGEEGLKRVHAEAVKSLSDKSVSKWLKDPVEGKEDAHNFLKKEAFEAMGREASYLQNELGIKSYNKIKEQSGNNVRLNTLSKAKRIGGQMREGAFGSFAKSEGRSPSEIFTAAILTEALNTQACPEQGKALLDQPHLRENKRFIEIALKQQASMGGIAGGNDLFGKRGSIYEAFTGSQAVAGFFQENFMEASQSTSSVIDTTKLPVDFQKAVIIAAWAQMISPKLAASVQNMTQKEQTIYDYAHPKSDTDPFFEVKHFFGFVDHGAATTLASSAMASGVNASDDGEIDRTASNLPHELYAIVGEAVNADTVVTATGKNMQGDTDATATVTILTTHAVGDVVKFTPTIDGDLFVDVSSVSASGFTSAGQVGIFTPQPLRGNTAGSASDSAALKLGTHTISEKPYSVQTNMTLELLEDINAAISQGFPGGLNLIGMATRTLGSAVGNYLDKLALDVLERKAYARNVNSFNFSNPTGSFSTIEWEGQFHYNLDKTATDVFSSSETQPNWQVWDRQGKPTYVKALGHQELHKFDPLLNDPFKDAKAKYSLLDANIFVSGNSMNERILMGSNNQDTGLHIAYYVPLTIYMGDDVTSTFDKVVMARTRVAQDVVNGRGLGVLKTVRR